MATVNLVDRVKNILLVPRTEWPAITAESDTVGGLYTRYIMVVAAIPAVAGFIKGSLIGTTIPLAGVTVRSGIGAGLTSMVVGFALSLVAAYLLALIVNALAQTFGGQKDMVQALKTVAYAYTASWVAGAAVILPWIGWLLMLAGGVYAFYLLHMGLPSTMRCPPDKATAYTVVTALCALVLWFVMAAIVGGLGAAALMSTTGSSSSDIEFSSDDGKVEIDADSPLGQLGKFAKGMEAAGKKMEAAEKSGNVEAQSQALNEAMGAMFGGGKKVEALKPEQIKPFIPDELADLPRTSYNVERNAMMGFQVASGKASYRDDSGERRLNLEITDMGSATALTMLAGWAAVESQSESDQGYERVYQENGTRVHEQWDTSSRAGTYDLIVAERFVVKLQGNGLDMDDIKKAASSLDLSGLAELKDEGVVDPG
ncbi:MAG: Yip1 family protein [Panacagrimonas sp.]